MTPTIDQMKPACFYRVLVKQMERGTFSSGVEYPHTDIVYSGVTEKHALELAQLRAKSLPNAQVTIERDSFIMAISVNGSMLLLDRVPPMKYWLNHRKRPDPIIPETERRIAACGLPIPAALCEQL
jgi:hypothetical protein